MRPSGKDLWRQVSHRVNSILGLACRRPVNPVAETVLPRPNAL